jgi:hypothetical protein
MIGSPRERRRDLPKFVSRLAYDAPDPKPLASAAAVLVLAGDFAETAIDVYCPDGHPDDST